MVDKMSDSQALGATDLGATDRSIMNLLQEGLPICERPFAAAARMLGLAEDNLLNRLEILQEQGFISRLGPMYHAEKLGGGLTLAALRVPDNELERVAEQVNAFPEVAHNYQRDHPFNMWFVVATETPEEIGQVLALIAKKTGYPVRNMPKQEEFFVGLKLEI